MTGPGPPHTEEPVNFKVTTLPGTMRPMLRAGAPYVVRLCCAPLLCALCCAPFVVRPLLCALCCAPFVVRLWCASFVVRLCCALYVSYG